MTLEFEEIIEPFVEQINEDEDRQDLSIGEIKRLVQRVSEKYDFSCHIGLDIWDSSHSVDLSGSFWWANYWNEQHGCYTVFRNALDIPRFLQWLLRDE